MPGKYTDFCCVRHPRPIDVIMCRPVMFMRSIINQEKSFTNTKFGKVKTFTDQFSVSNHFSNIFLLVDLSQWPHCQFFILFGYLKWIITDFTNGRNELARPLILSNATLNTGSGVLYCTLITTAWLKIPRISRRDRGTWQKTKKHPSQKWQQRRQKQQQQRTWREAEKWTKTYLHSQREHHHPLGFELNPMPPPPPIAYIHAHKFPRSLTHLNMPTGKHTLFYGPLLHRTTRQLATEVISIWFALEHTQLVMEDN